MGRGNRGRGNRGRGRGGHQNQSPENVVITPAVLHNSVGEPNEPSLAADATEDPVSFSEVRDQLMMAGVIMSSMAPEEQRHRSKFL